MTRILRSFKTFLSQRRAAFAMGDDGDPRDCRGRRYRWRALWATLLLGMTRCTTGLRGLEDDCEDFGPLARCLGACKRVGRWALGNFLRRADPAQLRAKLWEFVREENRRKSLRPVRFPLGMMAVDGKQDRRALSELVSDNVQWVHPAGHGAKAYGLHRALRSALVSSAAPVVLDTAPVCGKTNETRVFLEIYPEWVRHFGSMFELVSGDAGFCTRESAQMVHDSGRGYLFGLKENQPTILEEAKRVLDPLADREAPMAMDVQWERDPRNRRIRRKLWVTQEMAGWHEWSHLRQVFLVRTEQRHEDGTTSVLDTRYVVTNMTAGRLNPSRALRAIRLHWTIENEVFGTLDRKDLWAEDTTTAWSFKDNGLENGSILRCLAFNLVSLWRGVHLTSDTHRSARWQKLLKWLRHALDAPGNEFDLRISADGQDTAGA